MRKFTVITHPTNWVAVHSITRETTNKTPNVTSLVKFQSRNTLKSSVLGFNVRERRKHKIITSLPMNGCQQRIVSWVYILDVSDYEYWAHSHTWETNFESDFLKAQYVFSSLCACILANMQCLLWSGLLPDRHACADNSTQQIIVVMCKLSWLFEYETGATYNGETDFQKACYKHQLPVFRRFSLDISFLHLLFYVRVVISREKLALLHIL
jgi:hypothetical protein